MTFRDLTTLEEFRRVVELEKLVWGYTDAEDVVPVPILVVTVKRGGILIGAFDGAGEMVGFVYSLPAMKDGRPTQWSHMLGVLERARDAGTGRLLKLEQRRRALGMGLDLIEWTYDPMQALNAHLNLARLGATVSEYEVNIYGESSSPLHRGTPTDRFVAEWELRAPRVEARIAGGPPAPCPLFETAAAALRTKPAGDWIACEGVDLDLDAPRVTLEIPMGFGALQAREPGLARTWRQATRDVFLAYFGRGYRVTEFQLDRVNRRGTYLLESRRQST
jgi:predicted GNAT superfamily acetyltransferase